MSADRPEQAREMVHRRLSFATVPVSLMPQIEWDLLGWLELIQGPLEDEPSGFSQKLVELVLENRKSSGA